MPIALVPPTLKTVAYILANRINLQSLTYGLLGRLCEQSFLDLASQNYPLLKIASIDAGHGLSAVGTCTGHHTLIWIAETRCHAACILTPTFCLSKMPMITALSEVEKSHRNALEKLPRA